jgi:hypothetical protein
MDDEKPETSHLVLKPRVVVPTDKPTVPGESSAVSVQGIHAQNLAADMERGKKRHRKEGPPVLALPSEPSLPAGFKPNDFMPLNSPALPGDEEGIDVHDILIENRDAEVESGWGSLKRKRRRRSTRSRDFVLIVGAIDITLAIIMKVMPSPMTVVYGLAGITLSNVSLGWIMFVVMDDY